MIWVTWRRLRGVLLASGIAVVALVIVAIANGRRAELLGGEFHRAPCFGGKWTSAHANHCGVILQQYFSLHGSQGNFLLVLIIVVLAFSSVIGALAVAGEFDRGTVRWAWTQSRSRRRWWGESTLVAFVSTAALVTPLALTMSWWEGATQYGGRLDSIPFLVDGWVLVPTALGCVAVTITAGLLVRKPGWLVVASVVIVGAGYYYVQSDFRANLVPVHTLVVKDKLVNGQMYETGNPSVSVSFIFQGYRRIGVTAIPSSGLETAFNNEMNACTPVLARKIVGGPNPQGNETPAQTIAIYTGCRHKYGLELVNVFISQSEFWTLQDREGTLFLSASALLWLGGCWWVRRTSA